MEPLKMNLEIRGARKEEFENILEQVVLSFNYPAPLFLPQLTLHPGRKPEHTRLAFANGILAASAQIFPKKIYVRGIPVTLGAIANVGTLPEYRHRGINEKLFKDVIQFMKDQGMEISGLYTGVHDVYRPHGYEIWAQKDTIADISAIATPSIKKSLPYKTIPIDTKQLAQVRQLYDRKAISYTGPVCRDKQYWEKAIQWNIKRDFLLFGAIDKKGNLVAYLRAGYSQDGTQAWIREAWGIQDTPEAWDSLLLSLFKIFKKQGCKGKIRLPGCFVNHPVTEALTRLGARISYRNNNGQMLRILHPRVLFKKLLQEKPAGNWVGSIQINTPEESFLLKEQRGKIQIATGDSSGQITLSHPALTQWVLGRKLLSELPYYFEEATLGKLHKEDIEFLDALLPKTDWVYWYTDSY
jgi:predicted acetyltransferase